jgi:hypothetical protein
MISKEIKILLLNIAATILIKHFHFIIILLNYKKIY